MMFANNVAALRGQLGPYYLATPYSKWPAGLDDAAQRAAALKGRLLVAGVVVYSPIAESHAVARAVALDPRDHALWMPAGKMLFDACHGLIVAMMPGWRDSFGVGEEIKWARAASKPRLWMEPDTLTWTRSPQ